MLWQLEIVDTVAWRRLYQKEAEHLSSMGYEESEQITRKTTHFREKDRGPSTKKDEAYSGGASH